MNLVFDIGIPVTGDTLDNVFKMCDHIENVILTSSSESSGCGFGFRDIQIPFNGTEAEADKKVAEIIAYLKTKDIVVDNTKDTAYVGYYDEEQQIDL